jgi:uncharacterized protein (TIGR00251 family)
MSDTPARLRFYVQPRASKTALAGMHGGAIKIRIAAPPVDDAANRALLDFVARRLGKPRRSVRLVAGAASRNKVIEIDDIAADLAAAAFAES